MIEFSKCKECETKRNVSELKDNPNGVGKVCIDGAACKGRKTGKSPKVDGSA